MCLYISLHKDRPLIDLAVCSHAPLKAPAFAASTFRMSVHGGCYLREKEGEFDRRGAASQLQPFCCGSTPVFFRLTDKETHPTDGSMTGFIRKQTLQESQSPTVL